MQAYSFTLLRIQPEINTPSRNRIEEKSPLSILRTGAGRGKTKKWLCIAWRVIFLWRACLHEDDISGNARCHFRFPFLGVLWLGLFLIVYLQVFLTATTHLSWRAFHDLMRVDRGWIPNAHEDWSSGSMMGLRLFASSA